MKEFMKQKKKVSNQMEKESTEEKMIKWREFTAAIKKLLHRLQF